MLNYSNKTEKKIVFFLGLAHQQFEKREFVELIVNALTNDFSIILCL